MSKLAELQKSLRQDLFIRQAPSPSSLWKGTPPPRLRVYRNNVQSNWQDALEHDFPLTRLQFTTSDWDILRQRYFEKHPPQHWELNASIRPFPVFLSRQKVAAWVKELADWEWHDLQIFIDTSVVRAGTGRSNPTARVRVYQYQLFDWVERGAPSDAPPAQKPEVLVFYRDAHHTCHIREADPLMLLFLDHFQKANSRIGELEALRHQLLPENRVPLETVARLMQEDGLLL